MFIDKTYIIFTYIIIVILINVSNGNTALVEKINEKYRLSKSINNEYNDIMLMDFPFINDHVNLTKFTISDKSNSTNIFMRYVDKKNMIYMSIIDGTVSCFLQLHDEVIDGYYQIYCIPENNYIFTILSHNMPINTSQKFTLKNNMKFTTKPLYLEVVTDYQLYLTLDSSVTNVATYTANMFGILSVIYTRDFGLTPNIYDVHYWTTPDPYPIEVDQNLYYIRDNVNSKADVYILLCLKCEGGGMAYINGACDSPYNKAVAGSLNGYFPSPYPIDYHGENWDPKVFAHEIAHSLSAIHTHEFNPPIDTCGHNVYNCPATKSTIMSYCHTCAGGMTNIQMAFDSQNSQKVRNYNKCR